MLVATDLNQPMLDEARTLVPLPDITWQHSDAQELPFADASFDAYVCQYGLMFWPTRCVGSARPGAYSPPGVSCWRTSGCPAPTTSTSR